MALAGVIALRSEESTVGRTFAESKKRSTWRMRIDGAAYTVVLTNSRFTGRKKLVVNGRIEHDDRLSNFEHSWHVGVHLLSVRPRTTWATGQPASPLSDKGFDLCIDGTSFDAMPKAAPEETAKIVVNIISAEGLRNADWIGKSDPYCICEIQGKRETKFQTNVIGETLEPVWNFEKTVDDYVPGDVLEFTVMDKDPWPKSDDLLGRAALSSDMFYPLGFVGTIRLLDAGTGIDAYLTVQISVQKAPEEVRLREIFERCDLNKDGSISKIDLIKALRKDEEIADLFELPQQIRQEDGSRDAMERIFQAIDKDDDREINWEEFRKFFVHRPTKPFNSAPVSRQSGPAASSAEVPASSRCEKTARDLRAESLAEDRLERNALALASTMQCRCSYRAEVTDAKEVWAFADEALVDVVDIGGHPAKEPKVRSKRRANKALKAEEEQDKKQAQEEEHIAEPFGGWDTSVWGPSNACWTGVQQRNVWAHENWKQEHKTFCNMPNDPIRTSTESTASSSPVAQPVGSSADSPWPHLEGGIAVACESSHKNRWPPWGASTVATNTDINTSSPWGSWATSSVVGSPAAVPATTRAASGGTASADLFEGFQAKRDSPWSEVVGGLSAVPLVPLARARIFQTGLLDESSVGANLSAPEGMDSVSGAKATTAASVMQVNMPEDGAYPAVKCPPYAVPPDASGTVFVDPVVVPESGKVITKASHGATPWSPWEPDSCSPCPDFATPRSACLSNADGGRHPGGRSRSRAMTTDLAETRYPSVDFACFMQQMADSAGTGADVNAAGRVAEPNWTQGFPPHAPATARTACGTPPRVANAAGRAAQNRAGSLGRRTPASAPSIERCLSNPWEHLLPQPERPEDALGTSGPSRTQVEEPVPRIDAEAILRDTWWK